MLTIKQEKFVQELLKGKSQREAYKSAYDSINMNDNTIDNKASLLFKNAKVRVRYDELKEKMLEAPFIASSTDVLRELSDIALGTKKFPATDMFGKDIETNVTVAQRIKALEIMAKHHGLLVDKVQVDGNINAGVTIIDDIPNK